MEEKFTFEELQKQYSDQNLMIADLQRKVRAFESSELLKSRIVEVFRATPRMMAISDMVEGRYVDVNEFFLKTLGYTREELINKSSDDIQLFAELVQSDKFIPKLARLKRVENFPVKLKCKNGETRDFLFSADSIFFGDEKFLLTTYVDDSESARIIEMQNRSWDNVRDLFESLSNFVLALSVDEEGSIVVQSVNPKSREFAHVSPDKYQGMDIHSVDIPNKNIILEVVAKIALTGNPEKLPLLASGSDNEGYYLGVNLTSGEIIILWEPGKIQKSRERELLMQADVFERFADMIPEVVFEIDIKGRIIYANLKGLERFGYAKSDLNEGLTIRSIFGQEQLPLVFENLRKLDRPGTSSHNEYNVFARDGSQIPVISHTFAVFDNQDKIIGYRGILTDLTERKAIQDQILREKAYLEILIESAPESIVQTTLDGRIERINAEFTRVFGYTHEEVMGRYIDDLIIPEELKSEGGHFTNLAANNETVSIETTRMTKTGERIYVSLLIKPVQINDETTALYAIYRNITEKKKDIETRNVILNISNAALSQTESTDIYSIIQHELSRFWKTKNFYIVLYNDENKTLTLPFYTDEKDYFTEIPAKGTLTAWLFRKLEPVLMKVPEIDALEASGEIGLVGTPCLVWLGVPLIVENEVLGAMVLQDYENEDAFSHDDLRLLTLIGNQIALAIQRKKMMTRLIAERAKAEEAAKLKQQFMSTMSHEIRTPL
ncbi:MAG: PAS domain S-box protein, partial [Bacteroidia bacterium]